ncbi:retrovirus-related pol polyprotein from transposon TNT 1-94 [Tanacetum coccineum]
MAFLSAVFTPRYPSTNNQLGSSSNPRNKATVQDGKDTVQQVQGRQGQNVVSLSLQGNASGSRGNTSGQAKVVKCYNCQGEGHMARQCTQPKRRRDASWFKEKVLLVQEQTKGKELDEEQLAFLADPKVADAKVVLMAILSSCDLDVLSEVPYSDISQNDMMNQSVHELQYSELSPIVDYPDNKITSDSNIGGREKFIDSQIDDMIRMKNTKFAAFKTEIDILKQALSKHVKEKESLLTTLNGFKTEFKERESKSIDKEIVLENKNKELENIFSLRYQSPFYLKRAQRIKPILYDGNVLSKIHDVLSVVDDEETLILAEESRLKMSKSFGYKVLTKNSEESSTSNTPIKVEVPSELPKVSLLNKSLKKLRFHLASFDNVVKVRTTPDAVTEGSWGFEHTKKLQAKNTVISKLKETILSLRENENPAKVKKDIDEIETIIIELEYSVEKILEHANTLQEIVESARALSPLDSNLDSACKYVQRIQEVLVYVRDTCPCLTRPSEKLVVVTPKNKDKKVRFADPVTFSSNTQT